MKIGRSAKFIVTIGVLSLFADMTYEAARSIHGPYLNVLGASGTVVGIIAGLGELMGYGLRAGSGYLSDRTHKYWLLMIVGYLINLGCVPLLALTGHWQTALILIVGERIGKGIRVPVRDAMISYNSKEVGSGWAFGLHNALDSAGATIGPLLVSAVLFFHHHAYHEAYAILAIPAVFAMVTLLKARSVFPHPEKTESEEMTKTQNSFPKGFRYFMPATAFMAMGYADFSLAAFHFKQDGVMKDAVIPVVYAIAMLSESLSSLSLGKLFDRFGVKVLWAAVLISGVSVPLIFGQKFGFVLAGMVIYGIGTGMHESVLKSVVTLNVPVSKRGMGFGLFNMVFGVAWFIGSVTMGYLFDISISTLIIFSVICQLIAFFLLFFFRNNIRGSNP